MRTVPPPRMTPAEIMTFLRTSPQRHCAACLALRLGESLEETRSILGGLHSQGAVLVGTVSPSEAGESLTGVVRLDAGRSMACAVLTDTTARCWDLRP